MSDKSINEISSIVEELQKKSERNKNVVDANIIDSEIIEGSEAVKESFMEEKSNQLFQGQKQNKVIQPIEIIDLPNGEQFAVKPWGIALWRDFWDCFSGCLLKYYSNNEIKWNNIQIDDIVTEILPLLSNMTPEIVLFLSKVFDMDEKIVGREIATPSLIGKLLPIFIHHNLSEFQLMIENFTAVSMPKVNIEALTQKIKRYSSDLQEQLNLSPTNTLTGIQKK